MEMDSEFAKKLEEFNFTNGIKLNGELNGTNGEHTPEDSENCAPNPISGNQMQEINEPTHEINETIQEIGESRDEGQPEVLNEIQEEQDNATSEDSIAEKVPVEIVAAS